MQPCNLCWRKEAQAKLLQQRNVILGILFELQVLGLHDGPGADNVLAPVSLCKGRTRSILRVNNVYTFINLITALLDTVPVLFVLVEVPFGKGKRGIHQRVEVRR